MEIFIVAQGWRQKFADVRLTLPMRWLKYSEQDTISGKAPKLAFTLGRGGGGEL